MNNLLMNQIKMNSFMGLSLLGCGYLSYKFYEREKYYGQKMIMLNSWPFHDEVLKYLCEKYGDDINSFNYSVEKIYHFNEWRFRRKEKPVKLKVNMPNECDIVIQYQDKPIHVKYSIVKDNNDVPYKLMSQHDCSSDEEIVNMLELRGESKELLMNFVDEASDWHKEQKKKIKNCTKETMNIYYYKKDYWTLLSKSPKRPLSTVYLKENTQDKIMNNVKKFFSDESRDIYLSFGIPYKSVQLVHGPPGTGKTSLIKSIASHLDCDLYILPISKDMLDTNLVDAFSYISDNEDKERIIVIEDIDTLFDGERKEGDNHNGITLQAFLNCLDGFTCVEGTMLFLTANRPEVLDFAMIRSCRIDNKIELDYADKYQTKKMFETFLPEQSEKFKEFYKEVSHKKFTTAMLQEFFFYNRDKENILELLDDFIKIVDKNDPKNFEVVKEENKNFYS